jgi:hypothetical protein
MHERDLQAEHAAPRGRVDQLGTGGRQVRQRRRDVVDLVGDVVHAGAALGQELADRRVVSERGEQLDPAFAETHRRRLDALIVDPLAMLEPAAEQALVRRDGRIEVLDCDADVMDRACLHRRDATALSAMLAAMGRRLALSALVVLTLAACGGGSSSNGEAKKAAAQVVVDAEAAANGATTVHVVGAGSADGTPLKLDLWLADGKGKGHLDENGLGFDIVRIGDAVYVKGGDAFLRTFAGASAATLLHGRWLRGTTTSGRLAALAPLTDIRDFFRGVLHQHGRIVNRGETTRNGDRVVEIRDTTEGGSLFVAATGAAYPLALAGGSAQGDITFGDWNAVQTFVAPKSALDLSSLGK